ncbi:hypothetical protein ACFVP0_21535 [Streptomyces cinereoruber]|uniref:hypothetical protein n=1 Tax=Streptomyces cinereoruber TaxID=67260 RepID=UPI00369EEA02
MHPLRDAELNDDQLLLLRTLASSWHETGKWPLWGYIQHQFDLRGVDADKVLRSLHRMRLGAPFNTNYGFAVGGARPRLPGEPIAETATVRLTLATCYQLPEMIGWAGNPFVRVLRHMIELWDDKPVSPTNPGKAYLHSQGLAGELNLRPSFVAALPDLLAHEPAALIGKGTALTGEGGAPDRGPWEWEIARGVLHYRGVKDIHDYLDRTCKPLKRKAAPDPRFTTDDHTQPAPADASAPYLDDVLLGELESAAQGTKWKVGKLLALCRELNSNFAARNPYACAALIRAVTDHIPPVFERADFKQVAAQHVFAMQRTDKAHAQALVSFKEIAHDALHRPISSSLPMITMDDLPAPARLRAVLHELVTVLTKTGAS